MSKEALQIAEERREVKGKGERERYTQLRASQEMTVVKNLSVNAGDKRDTSSIPRLRRSPGGGHGNPLQYSCVENPMDRGAWQATLHRVAKSWTGLKQLSMHAGLATRKLIAFLEVRRQ